MTTIAYPDVSNHNGNMTLEAGTVAACAKATEGTTFTDAYYGHFKAEAARVGAVFFAYHFLHRGNGAGQAQYCHGVVGNDVAVMIDCEPTTGSNPTVQDCIDFANELRRLGGKCVLVYFPRWYWKNLGSPDLGVFNSLRLGVVSSAYTGYSDTGEGWAAYGNVTPVVWQWTDALSYSGQGVDFNAYRGSADELKALLGYVWAPSSAQNEEDDEMILVSVSPDPNTQGAKSPGIWALSGSLYFHVSDVPDATGFLTVPGVKQISIDFAQHSEILAAVAKLEAPAAGPVQPVTVQVDATAFKAAVEGALASITGQVTFAAK